MSPKKASKKKRQIVDTAVALFTKFGIRRVTIEEICRKAGASKMTFYKHFPNKIELLRHIWNGWFDEGYRLLDEVDATDIPFPEKLLKIIEFKAELVSRMSPEFIEEVLHADPELAAFVTEMRIRNYSRFMEFVAKAQARGDMRTMKPEFFLAVLDKLQEVAQNESLVKAYPDYTEFVREIHNFLFFGILPVEGRESR
jgi:AcrR family transcriptional regulator